MSRTLIRLAVLFGMLGCGGDGAKDDPPGPSAGEIEWETAVQPALSAACGSCHLGRRFAFASLLGSGAAFTAEETAANYQTFRAQISLDAPAQSRLLAKIVPDGEPEHVVHAGGALASKGDELYTTLLHWVETERADRCPDCGATAEVQYLAYVEQAALDWAFPRDPIRTDHGLHGRSRIMLQPIDGATFKPTGAPIDFLGDGFCGTDGRCDFGHLSANHTGTQLVFECRLGLDGGEWVDDVRWNICIAEIARDGRAENPRFLMPPERRHRGSTIARSTPFGLYGADGGPIKGVYDMHFWQRRRSDLTPVFSPDDSRIYLSSRGPDPRTGTDSNQSYHGNTHTNNIISVATDGSDPRTIYRNEGGEADFPFFLHNGNVAFHTWNLERMDRHLYTQATADGMMEVPVLLGATQGPNMWGKALQLANGLVLGHTGRRRSSIENYVLFVADHTLGIGLDPEFTPLQIIDPAVFAQVEDFPGGYCVAPPDGSSCVVDRFYGEPAYSPDGRAFFAYSPERTYVQQGEDMFLNYAKGNTLAEQLAALDPYLPKRLGISLIDHHGAIEPFIEPPPGVMYRYPTWVGPRDRPLVQPVVVSSDDSSVLHIADAPLWFGFRDNELDRSFLTGVLDSIVAVRVLIKVIEDNACLNDARPYRYATNAGVHDHPTHLGVNNATGYQRLVVPEALGGNAFGDVPLAADRSVSLRVPAGELLLVQGINAQGHVVRQHSRIFTLPPGHTVNTSVRRDHYAQQCAACHGSIDQAPPVQLGKLDTLGPGVLDYATESATGEPVDLTRATRTTETFLHAIRPLLDRSCVSCHSGASPAGELSLEAAYSTTGNYPKGKWATQAGLADPAYLSFVPAGSRVPAYNYSTSYAWTMREDDAPYREYYASDIAAHRPLTELAPWDPAYQNLFAADGNRFVYLGGFFNANFGRSDRLGGLSSDSWLLEILTGRDLDPTRTFTGPDHTGYLSENEQREVMAVIDLGWAFAARCSDRTVPSGPNAGRPWGDPIVTQGQ